MDLRDASASKNLVCIVTLMSDWVYTIILDHWGQCSSLQLDCGLWGSLKRDTADLKWDTKMAPLTAHFGHTGIDLNSLEILQYTTVVTTVTTVYSNYGILQRPLIVPKKCLVMNFGRTKTIEQTLSQNCNI